MRTDPELLEAGEEAICQGVVLPVLAQLGWDRDNIRQVVPQYPVGNGKVDYCLRARDRKVFIEVKRARESLDSHQKQLLDYSFQEGVEIAVLTSGLVWWLYLPLLKGSWEERRFLAVDIQQQDVPDAARHLSQFLSREAVADGSAVERARTLHESKEKERLVQQTIPRAWEELCKGPDELLVELLSDKVESLCGHRPDGRTVQEFLTCHVCPPSPAPKNNGKEPGYYKDIRRALKNPKALPSRIRDLLRQRGTMTRRELERVYARDWGRKPKSLVVPYTVRVLEHDGHLTVQGRGPEARLTWIRKAS